MPVWTLGLWIGEAYEDGNLAIFSIPRQMHIEEIVSRDMDMEVFVLLRRPVFVFFLFFWGVSFLCFFGALTIRGLVFLRMQSLRM